MSAVGEGEGTLKVYEYEGAVATTALPKRYIERETNEPFMIYDYDL